MAREPRSRRVLGHPVHPILTDMPIALWSLTLLWDLVALWSGGVWWRVGFWTLALGLAASLATAATGLLDARRIESDSPAQRAVNLHMLLMASAVFIFVGSLIARGGPAALDGMRAALVVALTAIGVGVTLAGAWFGGELVFRHGTGVQPETAGREIRPRAERDAAARRRAG